jgi:iron(III) transport system ATP-binding protein
LYAAPANPFVAEFVGRSSRIPVTLLGPTDRGVRVALEGVEWELTDGAVPGGVLPPVGPAQMVVRPEALRLLAPAPGAVTGVVTDRRFIGASSLFTIATAGGSRLEVIGPPRSVGPGDRVGIMPSRRSGGGIHLFAPGDP